jgi:hypothetical protein
MITQAKRVFFYTAGTIIMLMVGLNINKQSGVWWGAKKMNDELKIEISDLENENREMRQKIEYATSSAFISRQARELLGWGNQNDYWLELPAEEEMGGLFYEMNTGDKKAKYEEWLDLFR